MLLSVKVVTITPPRGISFPRNSILHCINCTSPATIGKAHRSPSQKTCSGKTFKCQGHQG